jgi:hypothetical protein
MKKSKFRFPFLSALGVLALVGGYLMLPETYPSSSDKLGPTQALAEDVAVSFPPLETFVHYTTVERGDVLEHMLTSRQAIDTLKAGQPLPVGTQLVLVDHRSGKLLRYLVAQKMGDGQDDWKYQSFLPDKSIQADENPARCYSCHQSRQDRQYMFTFTDALRFK